MKNPITPTALAMVLVLTVAAPAWSQVAGSSTSYGVAVVAQTELATGWSVRKSLLGKPVYNDAGAKIGKVEDLIISPDKTATFLIVGAGGFLGVGRHDVAVSMALVQDRGDRLVMPGASKDGLKAMPEFRYENDRATYSRFVSSAETDIALGKAKAAELSKKAGVASSDAKVTLESQVSRLQTDVKSAEDQLGELKKASGARWKEFEISVSTATTRLRKSIEATST